MSSPGFKPAEAGAARSSISPDSVELSPGADTLTNRADSFFSLDKGPKIHGSFFIFGAHHQPQAEGFLTVIKMLQKADEFVGEGTDGLQLDD